MPNDWFKVSAQCPFYITESKKSITCEGIIDNKGTVHLFARSKEKNNHKYRYCNNAKAYKYCEYYYSLIRMKYGGEKDE